MLSGSAIKKAAPKYVGEIDPSLHNFRIMKKNTGGREIERVH
jgi:hypothetical protein